MVHFLFLLSISRPMKILSIVNRFSWLGTFNSFQVLTITSNSCHEHSSASLSVVLRFQHS